MWSYKNHTEKGKDYKIGICCFSTTKAHIQINKPLKQVQVLQKHLVQRTVFTTYY
jgi:hypothetical protein